jgi:ABC-type nitrate/sulfonate/bicarbonate transport system substrate-binding protein
LGVSDRFDKSLYEVMLRGAGLKLSDVRFLKLNYPTEPELLQLLKNKRMDAFIAWEFDWPVSFAMGKYPVRQFPSYQHHYHFYGDVYFARTDYLQSHRDDLATFLRVTRRGWDEVYRSPAKYVQEIVQRWYPPEQYLEHSQSVTHREQLIELRLSKRFIFDGIPEDQYGQMSHRLWSKSLEIAREFGMVSRNSQLTARDLYERDVLELSFQRKVR